jgi:tetratricopeptide (TPR) repeat protein
MKTGRRQQLRTNELAQTLTDLIEFLKDNSGSVLAGGAAIVVVVALGLYWYSAKASARQQGWTDLYGSQLAGSPDQRLSNLRNVATRYEDPQLAAIAWLNYADGSLQQAMSGTRNLTDQQRLLSEAVKGYKTIIDLYPDELLAVAAARFKFASLAENQRRWDEAREHYQAVADDPRFEKLPHSQQAAAAVKRLDEIAVPVVFSRAPVTAPASRPVPAETSGPGAARPPATTPAPIGTSPSTNPAR